MAKSGQFSSSASRMSAFFKIVRRMLYGIATAKSPGDEIALGWNASEPRSTTSDHFTLALGPDTGAAAVVALGPTTAPLCKMTTAELQVPDEVEPDGCNTGVVTPGDPK